MVFRPHSEAVHFVSDIFVHYLFVLVYLDRKVQEKNHKEHKQLIRPIVEHTKSPARPTCLSELPFDQISVYLCAFYLNVWSPDLCVTGKCHVYDTMLEKLQRILQLIGHFAVPKRFSKCLKIRFFGNLRFPQIWMAGVFQNAFSYQICYMSTKIDPPPPPLIQGFYVIY